MRRAMSTLAAAVISLALSAPAQAQFVVAAPAPVVSYYVAPPVAYYAPGQVVAVPAVAPGSYYVAAAPAPSVAYYAAPPVAYYPAATVAYPVYAYRGLLGRMNVRTPFYRVRY